MAANDLTPYGDIKQGIGLVCQEISFSAPESLTLCVQNCLKKRKYVFTFSVILYIEMVQVVHFFLMEHMHLPVAHIHVHICQIL